MSCRFALLLISFSRCAAFYRFRTPAGCPTLPQQALLMGTESTECSAAGWRNARGRCRSPFDAHAPVIEEGRSAGRRESLEPQVLSQFLPTFVWSQKGVAPGRETAPQKLPASAGTPYWTKMAGQSPPIPWSRPPSLGRSGQFTLRFCLRQNACTLHSRRRAPRLLARNLPRQGLPQKACAEAAKPPQAYSIFSSLAMSFKLMVSTLLTPFSCMVMP